MDFAHYWFQDGPGGGYAIGNSLRFRGAQYLQWSAPNWDSNTDMRYIQSMWVKRGALGGTQNLFTRNITSHTSAIRFTNDNYYNHLENGNGGTDFQLCRDPSAWYHIFIKCTTEGYELPGTGDIYINGRSIFNGKKLMGMHASNTRYRIGTGGGNLGNYFNGYMAEFHQIMGTGSDQTLTVNDFGRFDANDVWVPVEPTVTNYGNRGWYLTFAPAHFTTAGGVTTLADQSGNGNDFTAIGFDTTTAGTATYDLFTDSPTNNDPQPFNGLFVGQTWQTYERANRLARTNGTTGIRGTGLPLSISELPQSGRHLFSVTTGENTWDPSTVNGSRLLLGICISNLADLSNRSGNNVPEGYYLVRRWQQANNTINASANTANATSTPPGPTGWQWGERNADIVCAWDGDTRNIWFGQVSRHRTHPNYTGAITWYDSSAAVDADADPDNGTSPFATLPQDFNNIFIWIASANMSTLVPRAETDSGVTASYTNAPTTFNEISCSTLPAADIPNGRDHFRVVTDTGANILTAAQDAATGFEEGLWIIKRRDGAANFRFIDSLRGKSTELTCPDVNNDQAYINQTGQCIAWCWNTDDAGLNAQAGFQIVTWTGTDAAQTVSHSLGEKPKVMWLISREGNNTGRRIGVYLDDPLMSATRSMNLRDDSLPASSIGYFNNTEPDTTEFTAGTTFSIAPRNYVGYLWTEIEGYSKFGVYTGNSDNDGPFIWCGFRPSLLITKFIGPGTSGSFKIMDTTRDSHNPGTTELAFGSKNQESSSVTIDILSNGFKLRSSSRNRNNTAYMFMAFAENPFGGSNVSPTNAR